MLRRCYIGSEVIFRRHLRSHLSSAPQLLIPLASRSHQHPGASFVNGHSPLRRFHVSPYCSSSSPETLADLDHYARDVLHRFNTNNDFVKELRALNAQISDEESNDMKRRKVSRTQTEKLAAKASNESDSNEPQQIHQAAAATLQARRQFVRDVRKIWIPTASKNLTDSERQQLIEKWLREAKAVAAERKEAASRKAREMKEQKEQREAKKQQNLKEREERRLKTEALKQKKLEEKKARKPKDPQEASFAPLEPGQVPGSIDHILYLQEQEAKAREAERRRLLRQLQLQSRKKRDAGATDALAKLSDKIEETQMSIERASRAPSAPTGDKILDTAYPFEDEDAKLEPVTLRETPYLKPRTASKDDLRPLWQILKEKPDYFERSGIAKEERNDVYEHSHLPPPNVWSDADMRGDVHGAWSRSRWFLTNRDTIKRWVDRMALDELSAVNGGKKVTVIEGLPGPGTVTRELLMRSSVGKVIVCEDNQQFRAFAKGLADDPTVVDPDGVPARDKLHVLPKNGFQWATYDLIEREGLLSHLKPIREQSSAEAAGPPPPLVAVLQLPNSVLGDQFFVQTMAASGSGNWLYKYGRVKVVGIVADTMVSRALAPPGHRERAKMSTLSRILTHMRVILPRVGLTPKQTQFFPPSLRPLVRSLATSNMSGIESGHMATAENHVHMCGYELLPRQRQVWAWRRGAGVSENFITQDPQYPRVDDGGPSIPVPDEYNQGISSVEYEALEFLLRSVFVLRNSPVHDSLARSYAGMAALLSRLTEEAVEAKGHQFPTVAPLSGKAPATISEAPCNAVKEGESTDANERRLYHPASFLAPMPKMEVITPETSVKDLTDDQWITLTRWLERWPFRPASFTETSGSIDIASSDSDPASAVESSI